VQQRIDSLFLLNFIKNIMILIVNEHRVEIGIRRSVGSRKQDIILHLGRRRDHCHGGGIPHDPCYCAGIALSCRGFGLGLLVAVAASALSGIVAGICPSFNATQIHPVDIIREI
jgi:putative ABC transport system permease protein